MKWKWIIQASNLKTEISDSDKCRLSSLTTTNSWFCSLNKWCLQILSALSSWLNELAGSMDLFIMLWQTFSCSSVLSCKTCVNDVVDGKWNRGTKRLRVTDQTKNCSVYYRELRQVKLWWAYNEQKCKIVLAMLWFHNFLLFPEPRLQRSYWEVELHFQLTKLLLKQIKYLNYMSSSPQRRQRNNWA